jgi:hypothetical protein
MEGKCSTKGAYFYSNARTTSAGMIARDEGGKVLLTAWRTLKCCSLSGEAEAKACLEGMRLMVEWIRKPICVESNSSSLMQALDKKSKTCHPGLVFCQKSKRPDAFYLSASSSILVEKLTR